MIGVLRLTKGEEVLLTDGKGQKAKAQIVDDNRKRCTVRLQRIETEEASAPHITIAISIIKNASRFEWFLEKATELGIAEIIPLICDRTESEKFRADRLQSILISAMLQSQQAWLPVLHAPISFELLFRQEEIAATEKKFIAHCIQDARTPLHEAIDSTVPSQLLLIGPEGDFTPDEVDMALRLDFMPVSLGITRLRTETAGVVAASILQLG